MFLICLLVINLVSWLEIHYLSLSSFSEQSTSLILGYLKVFKISLAFSIALTLQLFLFCQIHFEDLMLSFYRHLLYFLKNYFLFFMMNFLFNLFFFILYLRLILYQASSYWFLNLIPILNPSFLRLV